MGAGAIGSLFGGYLAEAGNDVILVGRENHVQAIRETGLIIRGEADRTVKLRAVVSAEQVKGPFDVVLLTVKAYDTGRAVREVSGLMGDDATLLCLQNGLGVEEAASGCVDKLVRGVTMNGSLLLEPGVIAHTGRGDTVIGELEGDVTPRVEAIAHVFSEAGLNTRVTKDMRGVVWTKTLVNAGINPLGALTGLRNGELLRVPSLKRLMVNAVEEGAALAAASGVSLGENPVSLTLRTAELTASNRNSMLQDVLKGKRTEIDFINGAISERGRRSRVPTPINDVLTGLVKGLEHRNRRLEKEGG